MKSIFYILTILFLSLLISCSEEPPTSVDVESLTKKPIKDPPPPPPPLDLHSGNIHLIAGSLESSKGKDRTVAFRVWTDFSDPQIRVQKGNQIIVAIYDIDNNGIDELLVYIYSRTGKGRNEVEHFELQIWQDLDVDTASTTYNLDGFKVQDIVIGELDGGYDGDEILLVGGSEIRIYNPNFYPQNDDFIKDRIKTIDTNAPYYVWGLSTTIGNADNDNDNTNEIIYATMNPDYIVVCDYGSGEIDEGKTFPYYNDLCDRVEVADVDNDNYNEIIWGGAAGNLHIVDDNINNEYEWVSDDLGGFIFGLAAADFDGDPGSEIAVGTVWGSPSKIFVLQYNGATYTNIYEESISGSVNDIFAGDADGDLVMEFVVRTDEASVLVYDNLPGGYDDIFNAVNLGVGVHSIYLK